jgi:hypothetical protein
VVGVIARIFRIDIEDALLRWRRRGAQIGRFVAARRVRWHPDSIAL